MLQIHDTVGTAVKGSITVVAGSGITSMSDALMGCQPRMELPSKPFPSSNKASSTSLIGIVTCCQIPRQSRNLRSAHAASFFFANATASFGVILGSPSFLSLAGLFERAGARRRSFARGSDSGARNPPERPRLHRAAAALPTQRGGDVV